MWTYVPVYTVRTRHTEDVNNGTSKPCPVERRGNALAQNRRSSFLVQWFSMTKEVQFNELVVWLYTGSQLKWLLGTIVLGQWPNT